MSKLASFPWTRLGPVALLAAATVAAPMAHALTPSEFFAKVAPSIWLVRTFDKDGLPIATGSAVVIAPETLVTNCHVLRKAKTFRVQHEGVAVAGTLDMWDPARDICQIKAAGLTGPAVELGDSDKVVVGQPVYTLGAPRGLELTLSNGLVSALRHDESGRLGHIQISAPISHGSSGGGLFDIDGRLIGITSSGYDDAQNLNFALPVAFVRELPARHLAALQKREATPAAPPAPPVPPPTIVVTTLTPPPAPVAPPPASPPPAAPPPVATVVAARPPSGTPRVPFLNDARQTQYREHVNNAPNPKACVISDNGHWACAEGFHPRDRNLPSDPKVRALNRCAELAGKDCIVYQIDDRIVYQPEVAPPSQP